MKYDVHAYEVVVVFVSNIEASSQEEAIAKYTKATEGRLEHWLRCHEFFYDAALAGNQTDPGHDVEVSWAGETVEYMVDDPATGRPTWWVPQPDGNGGLVRAAFGDDARRPEGGDAAKT